MSNKPTLDEILDDLASTTHAITKSEGKRLLTQLIADIIGEPDSIAPGTRGGGATKNLGRNKLRAEQRQRAKEAGVDL